MSTIKEYKKLIKEELRLEFQKKYNDLKKIPKNRWSPWPYIFWFLKTDFKKSLILILSVLFVLGFFGSVTITTPWFKKEKYEILKGTNLSSKAKKAIDSIIKNDRKIK